MKKIRKALALLLSLVLCLSFGTVSLAAETETADYTITNPYADVIWSGDSAWGAYKGSLHSHSTYSDADVTLETMVKEAYRQDYDFLAIADHGITGVDWDKAPFMHPLYLYQPLLGNYFSHLTTEEYEAIKNGTYENRGKIMVPVLGANEFNNLSLSKNHVNGHFLDSWDGNAFPGAENEHGFEQAISYIDSHGGLSYINHPGDWLETNENPAAVDEAENISFFGDLILSYDSCLGIEILNEKNGPTGYDRILWDNLLMYCLPYGKTVIGFSNTDAHNIKNIDSSFSVFMMEENTAENIKATMQSGAFFAITRNLRANDRIGPYEEIDAMNSGLPYPMFTNISVDGHSVSATTTDADTIQWIANGKVIATADVTDGGAYTLDLDTIEGAEDFLYIRAELFGEGGLCCSQAFVIDKGTDAKDFEPLSGIRAVIEDIVYFLKGTKLWSIIVELSRL
ncbi:MAG: hypothetical protein IKY78_03590 [Clostridia bacterium]|nr:hypothetical protein [Clostridia bacterium]